MDIKKEINGLGKIFMDDLKEEVNKMVHYILYGMMLIGFAGLSL